MERGTHVIVIEVNLHCDNCNSKLTYSGEKEEIVDALFYIYWCLNKDCSHQYQPVKTTKQYPYLDYQPVSKLKEMERKVGSSSNRVH